ncbi:MAG: succinate--CoA ligase subunit alpha [Actinobacteria bacterium]|nr:succinate--CoA ligase subunit alpha [Actinomycetota bacterium]
MAILVDSDTTIIVQGITGREAASFTKDSLDYGARILGGVTPGKGGQEVFGLPVTDTVRELTERFPVDASVISVPPAFVKDAAFEAIENGIRLLLIVTERVPRRDVIEVIDLCRLRGARLIGPNSLGVISPGKSRLGMVGGPAQDVRKSYTPGPVGIMSRSGGMTTEIANLLTVAGLGQSTCVSIGGDPIVGTQFADLVTDFDADPETEALVLFTEPGGGMEKALADRLRETSTHLPIFCFIAGKFVDEMRGVRFGHAATLVRSDADTTEAKARTLREAGVTVVEELSRLPEMVREALS